MDKLKIVNSLKNNKLFLSLWIFFVFLFLLFSIFYNWNFKFIYQNVFSNFEIIDANFDLNLKKVPYNTKSIDIVFSKDLDEKSISKANFSITPEVKWSVVLKDKNTISYILEENLKIWFDYVITIKKDIKSSSHNNLDKDFTYIIKVWDESQVIKFIPWEKLNNLTKNIWVFFSNPMVSLTTVENKLNFDCPIEITPKVEWRCFWTTNSILEFEPKNWFAWATKYDVIIKNSKDFNYPLSKEFKTSFSTQELIPNLANWSNEISPKNGIILNFNFPVDIKDLEKNLTLNWEKPRIEKNNLSDVSFVIKPKNTELVYKTYYNLVLKSWLKPKHWNIALKADFNIWLNTNWFLNYYNIYKNVYSQTWALVSTNYIWESKFLPKNNSFIRMYFDTEIELNKKLFSLKSASWDKIDFKIEHVTRNYDNSLMKNVVDLTLLNELKTWEKYSFKLLSDIDKNLTKDLVYDFSVPKQLEVYDVKMIDYKKLCLYSNNILDDIDYKKSIILPKWNKIFNIQKGQYIDDYRFSNEIRDLSFWAKNKKLIEKWYCAEPVNNQVLYTLDVRLTPNSSVDLEVKDLVDLYGSTQKNIYKKTFKTGNLNPQDKYIYNSFKNYINVFPSLVPINFHLSTINVSKVYLEVCELSEINYFSFLDNEYSKDNNPKCFKKTAKEIDVKNLNWDLSNTFVELEKDILNKPKNEKWIFLIRTYLDKDLNKKSLQSTNIAVKTNLGLQMEKWGNKTIVLATDLKNNEVVPNLNIEVYDHNLNLTNQIFKFNKNKQVYEFDGDLNYYYIKFSSKDNYWIITNRDFMDNYDFKYISWQSSSHKYFSYIYTDRPIYRQWDEVFIKWLFRKFEFDGYKKPDISKLQLEIYWDYRWDVYREIDLVTDKNGNFSTSFIIPNDSDLWNFKFRLKPKSDQDCDSFYQENWIECWFGEYIYTAWNFSIEQYSKPTFKIDLQTDNDEKYYLSKSKITVEPKYYFGGKVTNTNWNYIVLSQNYYFDPKDYIDYAFWNDSWGYDCIYWWYCNFYDKFEKNDKFNIDENWKFVLDYTYSKPKKDEDEFNYPKEKLFTFNFEITDPYSKKTVNNSLTKVLYLTDWYVWVKTNYFNTLKSWANLDFVTLNHNSEILPNKNIDVEIVKRDWIKNKVLWVDGVFYNNYELKQTTESKFALTTNNSWEKSYNFKPKKGWEYMVKVSYTWKNNQTYSSSTIFYIEWGDYISWRNENNTVTDVIAQKSVLNVGDNAEFMIKSPVNNWKILLVMQKDDWIFDYFVQDLKNYSHEFSYKITDKHYPNIYLKTYLIWNEEKNPLPIFKRWLWSVKVLSDFKKLNVDVKTSKTNYLPWEELEIEVLVKDQKNNPVKNANLSLSVVDQSVLALKWNPKKNPYAFFYEMRRFLWTVSYNNLYYLIDKLEIKDTTWWQKWWSWDQKWWETTKPRWNFKDTAYFLADVNTDKNWIAKIKINKLPDNLTTWVIEALVNTSDSKFWVGYSDIFTTQKVIIQDNLPVVLNTWDKIIFTPTIFNKTWIDQEFEVTFTTDKTDFKPVVRKVFLKSNDAKNIEFEFENIRDEFFIDWDLLNIWFEAKWLKSKDFDKISKNILVNDSYLKQTTVTSWFTKDLNIDENINLKWLENRDWNLEINLSPTLLKNNILSLDNLRDYWFSWLDYKNLYVFNIAIIKQLSNEFNMKFDLKKQKIKIYSYSTKKYDEITLDKYVKNYLSSLSSYRKNDWWFAFFEESQESNFDLTIWVFKTLNYLKSIWYWIDNDILNSAKAYIRNTIFIEKTCENNSYYQRGCILKQDKIKALNVLLDYDKTQTDLFDLYQTYWLDNDFSINNLELTLKLQNLTNLSQENKDILDNKAKNIVKQIIDNNLVILPRESFISLPYWDKKYNTLKFLELNSHNNFKYLQNSWNIINNMIKFVNFDYKFETQNSLEALLLFVKNYNDIKKTDFTFKLNLNSKNIDNHRFYLDNIFQTYKKTIPLKELKDNNNLTLAKLWKWNLYYDLILNYYIPSYESQNIDSWFYIEKTYFSFDEYKKIKELKQKEYDEYFDGKITYDDLKYKKNIESYLTPVKDFKVWELVVVYNKIISKNWVKNMIFESYIPAWSQIVNFELDTENKQNNILQNDFDFSVNKNLDDRFYGYESYFDAWFYNYSYILRLTNPWEFNVKPTVIKDKDFNEIFGSTKWEKIIITK